MKYLTTIAVVSRPVLRQVRPIAASAKPTVTYHAYKAGAFNKKWVSTWSKRLRLIL